MNNYFVVYFGEDGISISRKSSEEVEKLIDDIAEDYPKTASSKFEDGKEKLYSMDTGKYPEYKYMIIKGEVVVPQPVQVVTKFKL